MKIKRKITNFLLRKLNLQISADDVFTYTTQGRLLLGGEELNESRISSLKSEVQFLQQTEIWRVWQNTIADLARQRMFEKAVSFDDCWSGKMMLKNLEVMRDINKLILAWKKREVPKPISKTLSPIDM